MQKKGRYISRWQMISVIIMTTALVWLTVSLPFVYKAKQEIANTQSQDRSDNPFGTTTEEKAPTTVNIAEEFLHDHTEWPVFIPARITYDHHRDWDIYIAFHGELITPPPNA